MNKTPMTFDSNGIAASDDRLRSIAMECLAAERRERDASRAARAAGATFGTWCVDDISREAVESVGFFAAHYGEL